MKNLQLVADSLLSMPPLMFLYHCFNARSQYLFITVNDRINNTLSPVARTWVKFNQWLGETFN